MCPVIILAGQMRNTGTRGRLSRVLFAGCKFGEGPARHLAAADVSVSPGLTDTPGLLVLEAMAGGVPVAAFTVTGRVEGVVAV